MKLIYQIFVTLLLLPGLLFGAIGFGSKNSGGGAATTSGTIPWTNTASVNPAAVVSVDVNNATIILPGTMTVKINGTNMGSAVCAKTDGLTQMNYTWLLTGITTNSGSVVVTFGSSVTAFAIGVSSYSGVDQASPLDGTNTIAMGTVTAWALTNNIATPGAWTVDSAYKHLTTGTFTPGANQTSIDDAGIGTAFWGAASYQGPCNGANATNTWTASIASDGLLSAISLKPAASTSSLPPIQRNLLPMGVGQ